MFDLLHVRITPEMENSGESGDDGPLGSTFLSGNTVAGSYIGVQSDDMEGRLAFPSRAPRINFENGKVAEMLESFTEYYLVFCIIEFTSR